jgi:hypothetical protein
VGFDKTLDFSPALLQFLNIIRQFYPPQPQNRIRENMMKSIGNIDFMVRVAVIAVVLCFLTGMSRHISAAEVMGTSGKTENHATGAKPSDALETENGSDGSVPPDPEMLRMTAEGVKYYKGQGVLPDYDKAEYFFLRAARRGGTAAMYTLGYMYQTGQGVQQDAARAAAFYLQAAESGHGLSQYAYANMHYHGLGVEKNVEEAAAWYLEAAGRPDAEPEHLYAAGVLFDDGIGRDRDFEKRSNGTKRRPNKALATPSTVSAICI